MSIFNQTDCLTLRHAVLNYLIKGYSVIPLIGKKCPMGWTVYMQQRATAGEIRWWEGEGWLQNLGVVCGAVSGNLVVVDLDGASAVNMFQQRFPDYLRDSYIVRTGNGLHVYLKCDQMPKNRKISLGSGHSGLEIRGEGQYVVAPPSIHPDTQKPYEIAVGKTVLRIFNLNEVNAWLDTLAGANQPVPKPPAEARSRGFYPAHVTNPQAWTNAAVTRECHTVRATREGSRNNTLFSAAYNLGQIVGMGWLTHAGAESALLTAAKGAGLPEGEARDTIQSGLKAGIEAPREMQWLKRKS